MKKTGLQKRFESKFKKKSKEECWIWESAITPRYGVFWKDGGNVYAHRLSYELYRGEIPEGMLICHTCDNGICVNPNHLFVGTSFDNMQDKVRKGRLHDQRGEKNPTAKLSDKKVEKIISLVNNTPLTYKEIGEKFDVKPRAIRDIMSGKAWSHINGARINRSYKQDCKKIKCFSDHVETEHPSIASASKVLNISSSDIVRVLKGKKDNIRGLKFEYL